MRLHDLTHQSLPTAVGDVSITGLAYDSRQVQPGALFAAWRGARADGHVHVAEALRRGASVILCEREVDSGDVPRWVVPNVRHTLAELARRFYHDPSSGLRTVAVTGTNGKTTSVCILESIFAAAGYKPGIIGTLGNRYAGKSTEGSLTTPESVDLVALLDNMRQAGVDAVAMETSSQALSQHRVDGVRFDAAIFTNLTHDHLDYHGTEEAYFAAKARLFADLLKTDAWAVVNADDPWARRIRAKQRLTFSRTQSDADVVVQDARLDRSGASLTLRTPGGPCNSPRPCSVPSTSTIFWLVSRWGWPWISAIAPWRAASPKSPKCRDAWNASASLGGLWCWWITPTPLTPCSRSSLRCAPSYPATSFVSSAAAGTATHANARPWAERRKVAPTTRF